ncbi:MAG: FeoA family protein [Roseovarius sp.]
MSNCCHIYKSDAAHATQTDMHPIPLTEWPLKRPARIVGIEPPESDVIRLKAMGLCEGRMVTVQRRGSPLVAMVYRTRIALSPELARRIQVSECPLPLQP